jgi:hypothetical protein
LRTVEPYHLKETAIVVDVDLLLELGRLVTIEKVAGNVQSALG